MLIDTKIDWRLGGFAELILGWAGWLAVAVAFVATAVIEGVVTPKSHATDRRRAWSGIVLALVTALIGAVSATEWRSGLEDLLPVAWRS